MKDIRTYLFVIIMCSISALTLSVVSTALKPTQLHAQNSYKNAELLKAADLLPQGATHKQIQEISEQNLTPMLTDAKGNIFTFAQKNLDLNTYLQNGEISGYFMMPLKLFYQVKGGGVVLPVNGFGLWDAIYGFIGIEKNGFTITGISWYNQKETPGLGGEIQNPTWQKAFKGKSIFHGKKLESFGLQFIPIQMLALLPLQDQDYSIDAISGATITTDGVQNAIKNSLSPYIPLLKTMQKR